MREAWYRRGVEAFQCVSEGYPSAYVCPLCRDLYDHTALESGALTLEHVPPQNLGGRELVLTCRQCNNKASNALDRHAKLVEQRHQFDEGTLDESMGVRLTVDGVTIHGGIRSTHNVKSFTPFPEPRGNRPGVMDAMGQAIRQRIQTGESSLEYTIEFIDAYREDRSRISWLRSGYLVAFAIFGFRYVLSAPLRPVREQIANPDDEVLRIVSVGGGNIPISERRVMVIESPDRLRSLAVQFGRQIVLLPDPWSGNDIYASLEDDARAGRPFHPIGTGIMWPRRPEHVLDFHMDHTGSKLIAPTVPI